MAVMGDIVQAHVSVPKEWLIHLEGEDGIVNKLEDLTEQQWSAILSFALGYIDYSNVGIQAELKDEAGIK
jgi:hypothetical protein